MKWSRLQRGINISSKIGKGHLMGNHLSHLPIVIGRKVQVLKGKISTLVENLV
jgi:hypothetical protein